MIRSLGAIRVAVVVGAIAQVGANPIRLGEVARRLAERDVATVAQLAETGGCRAKPWLMNGDIGQLADFEYIEAYCPPELTTTDLRRGLLVTVTRVRSGGAWQPWTPQKTMAYGQVRTADRDFDQVVDDQDINRPFRVVGDIGDDDLVSLVRFIRSGALRALPPNSPEIKRRWPIGLVVVNADGAFVVSLREEAMSGQRVTVRRQGAEWTVVKVGFWIV